MLDFLKIKVIGKKKGTTYVTPTFLVTRSKDLMTRGKSFYAVWDEAAGLWSKDEFRAVSLIDEEIKKKTEEVRSSVSEDVEVIPVLLNDYGSKKMTEWQSYVKALPDNFHELDRSVTFLNTKVKKKDYVSKRLDYPLKNGDINAYLEIASTLYDPDELMKLEWAIGAIISGDAKSIQKFIVLYGDSGAGKSTFLNIIEKLFPGYYTYFEAKVLASNNDMFALEDFKDDPLVAIQHDGDLSRIEDNTKLNSIVSHEKMVVNEKFKSKYTAKFDSFLFMGTNKPVKITDAKSGIIRRLIDVHPSGRLLSYDRYMALTQQIDFELGAIAEHCLKLYSSLGANYYDKYKANTMIGATNEFYNFMSDNYDMMAEEDGVTLGAVWVEYQKYCADTKTLYPYPRMKVKEELKNYFREFIERDGGRYKVYKGLKKEKFDYVALGDKEKEEGANGGLYSLVLDKDESIFDAIYADCPAQLASDDETPSIKWTNVKTKLKDIDTHKIHYVLVPENLVVIDFDFKDKDGKKDMTRNLMEASKWPATYAEFSKGGGVHLHYIYDGDVLNLSKIYEENIEVKVFKKADGTRGFSSLRRKLTKCNGKDIITINSGLPLKKGANDVVNEEVVLNEKALRTLIFRAVNKEYHGYTAPNIDLINKALDNAYKSGKSYDVSDLRPLLISFAGKSSNQASRCLSVVANMKFMSDDMKHADEESEVVSGLVRDRDETEKMVEAATNAAPIIFFDVEVFPNLLVICWKFDGTPRDATVKMINPTPEDVQKLFKYRLVGFNNKRYDNHILYAASIGYSNKKIFEISQGIVSTPKSESRRFMFGAAYNLSYTDIYDFSSKKQSLKKWEIEMGIHHQELGLPWDLPVDESLWEKVADYCVNDVMATEALFHYLESDWVARQILADVADGDVNESTNALTYKIVFGNEKKPVLVYTDLATGEQSEGR